jgi:hypothetical protein
LNAVALNLTASQRLLSWLQHTPLSTAIRRSDWAVMALEAVHLLGLALLGGAACLLGLAALRRTGLRGLPLGTLVLGLRPLIAAGLVLMIASGLTIASSMPFKYYLNDAFRLKMVLFVAALVATAVLMRNRSYAGSTVRQRGLALFAVLLWFGVGICGRVIGFL